MKYTLPALIFSLIRLSATVFARQINPVEQEQWQEGEPAPQIQVT